MKLYTEEQVIALTKAAFTAGQNHNSFIFSEELNSITPIELPSKEEIIDFAFSWSPEKAERIYIEKDYNETFGGSK